MNRGSVLFGRWLFRHQILRPRQLRWLRQPRNLLGLGGVFGAGRALPLHIVAAGMGLGFYLERCMADAVVILEDRPSCIEYGMRINVFVGYEMHRRSIHIRGEGPHVQVVHANDPWQRYQPLGEPLDVDRARCRFHKDAQRLAAEPPCPREDEPVSYTHLTLPTIYSV